jgi:putative Mg2+ transporter-C (MgtC) family protein
MPLGWRADADILLRLVIAMILAGIVGWDRERRGHSAGVRTNMLVGLSAALFTSTGDLLVHHFQSYGQAVQADPIRVLQAIVLGVSFLGSGIIFVSQG